VKSGGSFRSCERITGKRDIYGITEGSADRTGIAQKDGCRNIAELRATPYEKWLSGSLSQMGGSADG